MKRFTLLLTLLLIAGLAPLSAAKKRTAAAPSQGPTVTVSCAVCPRDGSPFTITASGFSQGTAVLSVVGPATGIMGIAIDNSGNFSITFANGLAYWLPGNYLVTVTQGDVSASTSIELI